MADADMFAEAAEDDQFVNAMASGRPKPTAQFQNPSPLELQTWKDKVKGGKGGDKTFTVHNLIKSSLGFYCFGRYIKEKGGSSTPSQLSTAMNFLEDATRYSKCLGKANALEAGVYMKGRYFNGSSELPEVTWLTECDLDKRGGLTVNEQEICYNGVWGKGVDNPMKFGGLGYNICLELLEKKEYPSDLFGGLAAATEHFLVSTEGEGFLESKWGKMLINYLYQEKQQCKESDFDLLRVLGRGGFGLVMGCKHGRTGKMYAKKIMNIARIKKNKCEQLTLNERVALAEIESPFVVTLAYSYITEMEVVLILEMMTGGDLSFHLKLVTRFPLPQCRDYAARIMYGVQAFHDAGFCYRDLKPENILMGDDGKVKITDLGLACKVTPGLKSAAGTRGYWAPEMLKKGPDGKKIGYNHMVDWFSFGVMLAEFVEGVCPFRSQAAMDFGRNGGPKDKGWQVKAIDKATAEMFPEWKTEFFDDVLIDLVTKLTMKNPKERLGFNGGFTEVMAHPWFSIVDFGAIKSDRAIPAFVPNNDVNAASQDSIGTFDDEGLPKIEPKDREVYNTWDWINPKNFENEIVEFLEYAREEEVEKNGGGGGTVVSGKKGGGCVIL